MTKYQEEMQNLLQQQKEIEERLKEIKDLSEKESVDVREIEEHDLAGYEIIVTKGEELIQYGKYLSKSPFFEIDDVKRILNLK